MLRTLAALIFCALLASCATSVRLSDAQVADACKMLKDNKSWHKSLRQSAKDWGAPMGFQLAVINQESSFDAKAKPPRAAGFLFLPGKRPSTAYGYAQALDTTWEEYQSKTGNRGANRHSFHDSVDFIGWYFSQTGKVTSLGQYDYKAHYLAYHEGAGGYMRGTWRDKAWLIQRADRVAATAARYESQISSCKGLKRDKFLGIF